MKDKKKSEREFEYCKVCRLNHKQGQKHKYFPNHKKSLSVFLSKFQSKISHIRSSLKNPNLNSQHHRLWCVFCDCDILELHSHFARGNAIRHLASMDHLKNLKHFMWKYGGGNDQIDAFRFTETDIAKWEKKCNSLKPEATTPSMESRELNNGDLNDIHIELNNGNTTNFKNSRVQSLKPSVSNNVMPLQYNTNEYQVSYSGQRDVANNGPSLHDVTSSLPPSTHLPSNSWSFIDPTVTWSNENVTPHSSRRCSVGDHQSNEGMHQVNWNQRMENGGGSPQGVQNLTPIFLRASEPGGNVHSGAPPPWLEADEINQYGVQLKPDNSVVRRPSTMTKSRKLNPKRVGAAWAEKRKIELEKEKSGEIDRNDYDSGWLPNFGRVWQSGSRKESRREFEKEKDQKTKADTQCEIPITVQPYISKRMRRDVSEG